MQIRYRLGRVVPKLGPRDGAVARQGLPVLLDEAHHVRPQRLQAGGALELVTD